MSDVSGLLGSAEMVSFRSLCVYQCDLLRSLLETLAWTSESSQQTSRDCSGDGPLHSDECERQSNLSGRSLRRKLHCHGRSQDEIAKKRSCKATPKQQSTTAQPCCNCERQGGEGECENQWFVTHLNPWNLIAADTSIVSRCDPIQYCLMIVRVTYGGM